MHEYHDRSLAKFVTLPSCYLSLSLSSFPCSLIMSLSFSSRVVAVLITAFAETVSSTRTARTCTSPISGDQWTGREWRRGTQKRRERLCRRLCLPLKGKDLFCTSSFFFLILFSPILFSYTRYAPLPCRFSLLLCLVSYVSFISAAIADVQYSAAAHCMLKVRSIQLVAAYYHDLELNEFGVW